MENTEKHGESDNAFVPFVVKKTTEARRTQRNTEKKNLPFAVNKENH
jgi:hypothetical protein